MNSIAVRYMDSFTHIISSEVIRPSELCFFKRDEQDGLIQILEIDQSFDGWETMTVLFEATY